MLVRPRFRQFVAVSGHTNTVSKPLIKPSSVWTGSSALYLPRSPPPHGAFHGPCGSPESLQQQRQQQQPLQTPAFTSQAASGNLSEKLTEKFFWA